MKCDLAPGIKSLSGKSGGVLFKTYRKPDGSKQTRAYLLPRKKNGGHGYTRTTPVSEEEKQRRINFALASAYASSILADKSSPKFRMWYELFKENKGMFKGKKYKTLRGYIMAVDFDDHKNSEQPASN